MVGLATGEGEGLHDVDLDALDRVVVGAGDHRFGELGERPRGGVMDDEKSGHAPMMPNRKTRIRETNASEMARIDHIY